MPRPARVALIVSGSVLGLLLLLLGVSFAVNGADIPRGVEVSGEDIGGSARGEARTTLEQALAERLAAPVRLRVGAEGDPGTVVVEIDPVRAGLGVDLDATLDEAASSGPFDRFLGMFGRGRDVEVATSIDDAALSSALAAVATQVDQPLQEGQIRFVGGQAMPVSPAPGRDLDVEATAEIVREGWLSGEILQAEAEITTPQAVDDAVLAALPAAQQTVARALAVRSDSDVLFVRPAELAETLTLTVGQDGALGPEVDGERLLALLGAEVAVVQNPPKDATFEITAGRPVLVPAVAGREVGPDGLADAVVEALGREDRTGTLELIRAEPELTTAEAEDLGIVEEIGTFTTRHPCCQNRVRNIQRIADLVDGQIVLPGEEFSLNDVVGERTVAKGFFSAPQILNGEFVPAVGGGISQFTTTIYNATFFAGLEDVEHTPHSYYISRYPEGREATISFPRPDFVFGNDSGHGVLITTSYTSTSITVTLYGTKRYDEVVSVSSGRSRITTPELVTKPAGPECTPSSGRNGFDITITRILKNDDEEVRRTSAKHRYLAEPRVRCEEPEPSVTPSADPSGSSSSEPDPAEPEGS